MVVEGRSSGEVMLAGGASASTLMYDVLKAAVEAYPEALQGVAVGDSVGDFKQRYADVLPRFEATRMNSERASEIAEVLSQASRSAITWQSGGTELALAEHVAASAAPLGLESHAFGQSGRLWRRDRATETLGLELVPYAKSLVDAGSASVEVVDGISWIADQASLDLRGRRVALLGAGAELAPTRLLLECGADVLWIDVSPPPDELLSSTGLRGSVHWVPEGADLLTEPDRIRATIESFAEGLAIDLGLYAYAPGNTREWRLTASMNAIVDTLPADLVGTITMLVSPTTCGVLTSADVEGEQRRLERRPGWEAFLARIGAFGRGAGHARVGDVCTNRGIVPIQGTSYAAAQYFGKLIAAEAWATRAARYHVSANTAGISRTMSMSHPVFDAAFAGARVFGIETFAPATTAMLNGLLAIRDWLDPTSPSNRTAEYATTNDHVRALTSTRVHGGIYQLPYPVNDALRVAAALGAAKDPRRIGPMIRRR